MLKELISAKSDRSMEHTWKTLLDWKEKQTHLSSYRK